MKIAVASHNRQSIAEQADRCHTFWIYQARYTDVLEKRLIEVAGEHGMQDPVLCDVNVLISGGLADTLRYRLKQRGIQAVTTTEPDPDRAVAAWLNGTLDELPPAGRFAG